MITVFLDKYIITIQHLPNELFYIGTGFGVHGVRINPGQILWQGRYVDQSLFYKVRDLCCIVIFTNTIVAQILTKVYVALVV